MPKIDTTRIAGAARNRHLAEGGTHCPYCAYPDVEGAEITIDAGKATQEVTCADCGGQWTNVYTLANVIEGHL